MPAYEQASNGIFRGPKNLPNSMHRILAKLNGKLNSQNYDTFYLSERVQKVHQPAQVKLDKFFDAKMKYGSMLNNQFQSATEKPNSPNTSVGGTPAEASFYRPSLEEYMRG